MEDIYELTPMQQGMLFHSLYDSTSGVYVEQLVYVLDTALDTSALKRAWQKAVERHAVLRTAFHWQELDKPLQVVHRHVALPWQEYDWRHCSWAEQQKQLEDYLKADSARGFDLTIAPLMRLTLVRTAEESYKFIWSFHHILMDGWCGPIILRQVLAAYEAFCRGEDLHLEPPQPYRNYIAWLQQQDLSQAETFWRETLRGFTTPTPLEAGGKPDELPDRTNEYGEQLAWLPAATTTAIQSFVRRNRLTLNTLVQGTWALLLSRYSGEEDLVFGITVSGRPADLPDVESMVGLFINTLPMRVRVLPGLPLLTWLKEILARQIEMRQYEYTPLVEVQRWSDVPRGTPLFESILVFENYPVDTPLKGQIGSDFRFIGKTNYPLAVAASPGTELFLRMTYDRRRFDDATIIRMLEHLQTLLGDMVLAQNPERRLGELSLLTQAERQQVLIEWNNTRTDYPHDKCIHELFGAQATQTPNAVAVVFEDQHLTYQALNCRADQLALRLRARGVGLETPVGICVERSTEMVIGLLGILKAGGAYVPLDPTYPKERLAFMLKDAQTQLLLAQEHLLENLPEYTGEVLCFKEKYALPQDQGDIDLEALATSKNLAYVVYTSGSTGRPKGILAAHQGVVNYLAFIARAYNLDNSNVVLQIASLSFDASVRDIIGPLVVGAKVVLVNNIEAQAPVVLLCKIQEHRVTHILSIVPTVLRRLAKADREANTLDTCVQTILVSGESLYFSDCRETQKALGDQVSVVNQYGPTECTMTSSYHLVADLQNSPGIASIGRPIANAQFYILDRQFNPVPVRVCGELYIGSAGLARGYLNRPDLTAQKFIPNPFSQESGARLYRTGDIVRYLPDSNIEFLGRLDYQVKVRGLRVELSEIEAALGQHPAVRETVVLAWDAGHEPEQESPSDGELRLAAYVAPSEGQMPTTSELRGFLQGKLPGYMIPSAFVMLETLPLTPNGKVDRQALPAPDGSRPELKNTFVPPRTPLEETLASLWTQILGIEQVGIYDNFFELGGHSLLATQFVSRLRRTFKVELPLRTMLEAPTVASLAGIIEETFQKESPVTMTVVTSRKDFEEIEL